MVRCLELFALFASAVTALPSTSYVLHESIFTTHTRAHRTRRTKRAASQHVVPLRIGLQQTNVDQGYARVMEISDPTSKQYGNYLSPDQVNALFAPAAEASAETIAWLVSEGIEESTIMLFENQGWIAVDLPVADMERLFLTKYYEHFHETEGTVRLGCDQYYIPKHIQHHIDYIVPGVKPSAPLRKTSISARPPRVLESKDNTLNDWLQQTVAPNSNSSDLGQLCAHIYNCMLQGESMASRITSEPGRLALQQTALLASTNTPTPSRNRISTRITSDLPQKFLRGLALLSDSSTVQPLVYHQTQSETTAESDVDISLAISLLYPHNVTVFQVDDIIQSESANSKGIVWCVQHFPRCT